MNATIKTAVGPTILLGSGTYFDYLDPENSEITIEDYAAGLAFECRFSGQCVDQRTKKRVYYSVAQHAVIGSYAVPPEYAFDFLMHESGEPVCGDMVSPLKSLLPGYRQIEKRCEAAILAKFGVAMSNPDLIKHFDLRMWATERQQLMQWDGQPWGGDGFGDPNGGIHPLPVTIVPVGPDEAYQLFLDRYHEWRPARTRSALGRCSLTISAPLISSLAFAMPRVWTDHPRSISTAANPSKARSRRIATAIFSQPSRRFRELEKEQMMAIVALLVLIPSAVCIITAGYLAVHGISGWGWFLFVGALLGAFRFTEEKLP